MRLSCLLVPFFSDILNGKMTGRDWAQLGAEIGRGAIDPSIFCVKDYLVLEWFPSTSCFANSSRPGLVAGSV